VAEIELVALDVPTRERGLEWGLAVGFVPSADNNKVERWMSEHGVYDNSDLYVFVTPDRLSGMELTDRPRLAVAVPDDEAAALVAELDRIDSERRAEDPLA
jgi:hypothetical protein